MSLRVVARIIAKPDQVEELKALLQGLLGPTREENGCIVYELLQNTDDYRDFTFVEEWVSAAALEAHLKSEHLTHALGRFPDLVEGDAEIRTYHLVG